MMKFKNMRSAWLNLFCAALLFSLTVSVDFARASDNEAETLGRFGGWQTVGPIGGDVRSMVIDPTNKEHLYFGTLDSQIYTSMDGGRSWRLLANFNRASLMLDSMLIDPRDPKTMFVAGHRHKEPGGVYKSTDGGETWREIKDMKDQAVYALEQSSLNPDMLVAGTYAGVYASYDAGNSWKKIGDETAAAGLINVESIAIDPINPDIIYAGTWYLPYKTMDGGKTWRIIKQGMIDDSDVFAINVNPRNPKHVFASACSGIYESHNYGDTWRKVQGIPSQSRRTRAILQHPTKQGYVFAGTTEGFWMSSDGGASWSLTTSRQLEVNSIVVHPEEPSKVILGTNNYGVMVSDDYGKTFAMTNGGFSTRLTKEIVADIEQTNRLYSTTINTTTGGGFFFVSTDGGTSWQPSMRNYPARLIAYSILQDKANPNTIYLGTNFGVYRSTDRGASWAAVTAPKKPASGRRAPAKGRAPAKKPATADVATAPAKPAATRVDAITEKVNVLVYTNDGKNGMIAATDNGLFRTYDIAKGWDRIIFPETFDKQVLAIATSPNKPETIWVGTARSGVLVSRDGGANWQQDLGITTAAPISSIAIDPQRPDNVYVGTKLTLFLTRDGGKSWDRRGGGLPSGDYVTILINPNNPNEIFTGSAWENRGGAFRSMDAGMTWARFDPRDANLPSSRVWSLAFDPRDQNRIFVGSHSAGIYIAQRMLTAKK